MAEERVQRRLAAILAADVVGYSRLMHEDEPATLAQLKSLQTDVIGPVADEFGGRIFKTLGDGFLVEFSSAVDAVQCAVGLQDAMAARSVGFPADRQIALRIGITLGDVLADGDDVFGDGVNVASRLEGIAEPGGIMVSLLVRESVRHKLQVEFEDLGERSVRNIADPVKVFRVVKESQPVASPTPPAPVDHAVRFCRTSDGVQIAHASVGQGPPVIIVSNWLTHLELDRVLPARRALLERLAPNHRVIRYDARGNGLSDWDVDDISLEASLLDLAAVTDDLALDRFALIGQSQGAAISAAFAARHPERVTHLVLYGGYARGRRKRGSAGQVAESDAFVTMIREGWGRNIDAYVRMFGSFFMPDASAQQLAGFTDLQRKATPPENAARIQLALDNIDISEELPNITAPTLVLHVREDARAPFEEGRRLAAAIPGARFVPLEGRNHSLLADDPALPRYLDEIDRFLQS